MILDRIVFATVFSMYTYFIVCVFYVFLPLCAALVQALVGYFPELIRQAMAVGREACLSALMALPEGFWFIVGGTAEVQTYA